MNQPASNENQAHKHQAFLGTTLPAWYVQSSPLMRKRLHRDMVRGQHIRTQLGKALQGLAGLDAFARPLLAAALDEAFGPGLDVDKDHFFHVHSDAGLLPLPYKLVDKKASVQSLLQAALQNFHQEEVDAVRAESVIFKGTPNLGTFAEGSSYPHPLKVAPARFMALCRQLDLGGKYQAHLSAVLEPSPGKGDFSSAQIMDLISHLQRNTLYVAAHVAHMQSAQLLDATAYQAVLSAVGHSSAMDPALSVDVHHLRVLGFAVRDVLIFYVAQSDSYVVYLPGEPTSALTQYASIDAFMKVLRKKLRSVAYQEYFAGFIAQRSKAAFLVKLRERLTPHILRRIPGDERLIPRLWSVAEVDENADLQLVTDRLPYPLLQFFYFQRMLRIKDDARALAVPTGDEDEASRRARLAGYLALGMNAVNFAALFVPVLGEVMMVVAGSQLLVETFEGFHAWAAGDMEQVLEHLGSVAQNLAMLAVFAAAGKAAEPNALPAIKDSSFVGNMVPVKLKNGQTRLWMPDLAPFATDVLLPQGMQPTAEGLFVHEGQHYIVLQERIYRVKLDAALNKWRIQPPRRTRFSPRLENNGAGAWRHEGENPLAWDVKTSFERLGYSVAPLSEQAAENVLAVTGTDQSLLTTLHVHNQLPPPALTDTIERFAINEHVLAHNPATPPDLGVEIGQVAEDRLSVMFDRLNQAREASTDPLVQLLKRDFASMTTAVAKELLLEADAEQLATMRATQRVPLSIAGRARGYLQQTRLNQALEGFFLASRADNPDTCKLALHLLQDLPGWPQDLRIDIRGGVFGGPLLDAVGERSAHQRRILVKRGNTYRAYDMRGNALQPAALERDNFFSAILHALPKAQRQAIGFPDAVLDVTALRQRIVNDATGERVRAGKILGQQAIKPDFRGPVRLADARLGYLLSGRGSLPAERLPAGANELIAVLSELYPEAPALRVHLENLMARGWSMDQLLNMNRARLRAWDVLRSALEGWVNPAGPGPSISPQRFAVRQSIANALGRAWRFSDEMSPMHSSNLLLENLDLTGLSDMPDLPAHYAQIHYLTLSKVTGSSEDINRLLGRFPSIQRLELIGSGLTALPEGVAGMSRLEHLSIEGLGLNIDQPAMELFMRIPLLNELDLTGNFIGDITDVSRLRVSSLWLNETGLTEWPEWVDSLPLQTLDISENQITALPEHIIENSQGQPSQLTIHAYGNPLELEDLRRFWLNDRGFGMTYRLEFDFPEEIRDLDVDTTTSSDDDASDGGMDWHTHSAGNATFVPPVPALDIWLVEGRTELNARFRVAWEHVETAGDAPNLLVLLQRLREAPDFKRFHEELANDVLRVLEMAADDPQTRTELDVMANDRLFGADQTCQDGVRLVFSDIQVAVYARSELQGVPEAQHTEVLFRVIRGLFRLNEVQTLADLEIASRESRGVRVDNAEVRMAYRIGLANDLNLPGQPLSMAWDRLASVDRQSILSARRVVLEREAGTGFIDYAVADRRWNERLRAQHADDLRRVAAPIRAQMIALEEHPPIDSIAELRRRSEIYGRLNAAHESDDPLALRQTSLELSELARNPPVDHDEYDRQGRALMASLEAAEKALLEQLTSSMRQRWF